MGSCSLKSTHDVPSIKAELILPKKEPQEEPVEESSEKAKEIKVIPGETLKFQPLPELNVEKSPQLKALDISNRKSRKNLTVLATNTVDVDVPHPLEKSLKAFPNEIKPEQGSLMVMKHPISIGGRPSQNIQPNYEEKLILIEGEEVKRDFLLDHGMWVCCKKGMKPESPNQDDFMIVIDQDMQIFGVFDGHGSYGHEVSNFVHMALPKLLVSHLNWEKNPEKAYLDCFVTVHGQLMELCNRPEVQFDCALSGCTATLVTIRHDKLHVAHVGDSRAVLCKRTGSLLRAQDLTQDHKPGLEKERLRIESSGGEVKRLEGDIPERVFIKGRVTPGIAMSRAIGDAIAQTVGVSHIPETSTLTLTDADEVLIICSDGVWEFITSQQAADLISKHTNPKAAAEELAQEAWNKWVAVEGDVVDDITVIIVFLKKITTIEE